MKQKLVIVGNGMVTGRFLDELLNQTECPYDITVLSAEAHGSYNRIMLSSVLSGEASVEGIVQKTPNWFAEHNINLHQNEAAIHIDRAKKQLVTSQGSVYDYDQLVMATGSRAARLPAQTGCQLKHIYPFRSLLDTQNLLARAEHARQAVVIGGGFLGLEAAWGLQQKGLKVTLIHRSSHLLNRQLDAPAARLLQQKLESLGLEFKLGDEVDFFAGEKNVEQVKLQSGEVLECDMVVISTGITANAELAWAAGLPGDRAIRVDELMQTEDPHVSAIGECIEFQGATYGLVDPLWRQAQVLATRLCQAPENWLKFEDAPVATKLKISGVALYSAGQVDARDADDELIINDPKANIYRKLILNNGRIVGIVLYGDVRSGAYYFDLMQTREVVSTQLPKLLFGQEYLAA